MAELILNLILVLHVVNPCGGDGQNEWLILQTDSAIAVSELGIGSVNPTSGAQPNYNFWWGGANRTSPPGASENCGAGLFCYQFSEDAAIIANRINTLNTTTGCNLFVAAPDTIPANSFIMIFLSAGAQSFDNPALNLDFSDHCGFQPYYTLFGTGSSVVGYFSNSNPRQLWVYPDSISYDYTPISGSSPPGYYTPSISYSIGPSCGVMDLEEEENDALSIDQPSFQAIREGNRIGFRYEVQDDQWVWVRLFDIMGRSVYAERKWLQAGENEWEIEGLQEQMLFYSIDGFERGRIW